MRVGIAFKTRTKHVTMRVEGREYVRGKVRQRDKDTCRMCGTKWTEGNRKFIVHHLNGECGKKSKSYDSIKDIDKLITLCHKCHPRHPHYSLTSCMQAGSINP